LVSQSLKMVLPLAVDRASSIQVLKDIQSLAFSVQRYLELTPETHCSRCLKNKNKKNKKKGTNKLSGFRPFRMRNISSTAWNRRFCGYAQFSSGSASSPMKPVSRIGSEVAHESDNAMRVEDEPDKSQPGISIADDARNENSFPEDDHVDCEDSRLKLEQNSESPTNKDISAPQPNEQHKSSDLSSNASGQEPSTPASEILKNLASRTKSTAPITTESPQPESDQNLDRSSSNFPPAVWSSVGTTASTSSTTTPPLPAKRSSASDILKSIASSFASKRAKFPGSDESESLIRDDVEIHSISLSSPSSSPTGASSTIPSEFSVRKSRPSSEILKSILESIPAENASGLAYVKHEFSQEENRVPTSSSASLQFPTAPAIPSIFGGRPRSHSVFSYPPSNPFYVDSRFNDSTTSSSASSLLIPPSTSVELRPTSSYENYALTASAPDVLPTNGNPFAVESPKMAAYTFPPVPASMYSSTTHDSWKSSISNFGEKILFSEAGSDAEARANLEQHRGDRERDEIETIETTKSSTSSFSSLPPH